MVIEIKMKTVLTIFFFLSVASLSGGCVKLALRASPSLFPHLTESIFEECDPELAESAIPGNLKLMEGLLKSDPDNLRILTTLSMGFCGYSLLFVEDVDPERASRLYLRARDYGLRALGERGHKLRKRGLKNEDVDHIVKGFGNENLEALFWTTMSWSAWINLNLDKPAAVSELGLVQRSLKRILELDPHFLHGSPNILMGISLAARPEMFGGNPDLARFYFEKALKGKGRQFFMAHYYYARYYAMRVQDKDLFLQLLQEVLKGNPYEPSDACLINKMMQIRTRRLIKMADEFFF